MSEICDEWRDDEECNDAIAHVGQILDLYSDLCACHRVDCGHGTCYEGSGSTTCMSEMEACQFDSDCDAILQTAPENSPPDADTCNANARCAALWACHMNTVSSGSCICDEGWGGERCDKRLCNVADFMGFISPPPTTVRYSAVATDSGEERVSNGKMKDLGRSDLDLMRDGRHMQVAAIRFRGVQLPDATLLADAHILFDIERAAQGNRHRSAGEPVTIEIAAELSTMPTEISAADHDLSGRTKTTARVLWTPESSTAEHEELVTPNLAPLLAEIAALPGYSAGSAVTIIFTHVSGTGVRWAATESKNRGIETPSLMISSGVQGGVSQPSSPDVWASLRGPAMRAACGRVLSVSADDSLRPQDDAVWAEMLCDCFKEVSPQEADEMYHCAMPGADDTVYQDWLRCQGESVDIEAKSEACPFAEGDGSPCDVEACISSSGLHATEQCCLVMNEWCAASSDRACDRVPALCDEFLPTGVELAMNALSSVCPRELVGCTRKDDCKAALETFLSPLDDDPTHVLQLQIRSQASRKMQRLGLCAAQANLEFLAPISPCDAFPCRHEGTCNEDTSVSSGFTCTCAPGWTGATCELDVDECASSPCDNGGMCENGPTDSYKCRCTVGFRGDRCQKSAQPAKTTMGGTTGISREDFLTALTATSSLSSGDVEITSATYTVEASVQLPVAFPDEGSEEGQAARSQFRAGIAVALGLTSAEQVEITGVGRRRLSEADVSAPVFVAPPKPMRKQLITDHKMKFLTPKLQKRKLQREQKKAEEALLKINAQAAQERVRRLQDSAAVDYSITAEDDLSSSVQTADIATAINDAGDVLAPMDADDIAVEVSGVETEITFDIVSTSATEDNSESTPATIAAMDDTALASALGTQVAVEELPLDICSAGLIIEHSNRHVANPCSGAAGSICEYTCDAGYAKTTAPAGHVHTCGGDGAFSGGECLPLGSVVCPDSWNDLTPDMIVGYGSSEEPNPSLCDALAFDTDNSLPTTSIEEAVLAAQEKWSHCLGSSLAIEAVLCNGGEACNTEFEIGSTTVDLVAVNTVDMSEATCSFSVTVSDNEPPTINPSSCPKAIVATKGQAPWPTIISEDNSGEVEVVPSVDGLGEVVGEELTAATAPTGQHKIVFTASDASGNTASCGAVFGLW